MYLAGPPREALGWLVVDVIGAVGLVLAAAFAFAVAMRRPWPGACFWVGASAGLAYLAIDERFSFHERIGRRLYAEGVPIPPRVNHMDDVVLLTIGLIGLIFSIACAREILASARFALCFLAAGTLTLAGLTVDAAAPVEGWAPRVEEALELSGQLLLVSAFGLRFAQLYAVHDALEALRRPRPVGGEGETAAASEAG